MLKCPEYGCDTIPTEDEVKELLANDQYSKYKKFNNNRRVAQDKNLFFCSTPNCEEVFDVRHAKKKMLTCEECKKSTCSKCKKPFHGKTACEKKIDKELENWAG